MSAANPLQSHSASQETIASRWSSDQLDVFAELINIGIGSAAARMSDLVGEEVSLSVPSVEFLEREQFLMAISSNIGENPTCVAQTFSGKINGNASLLFSEDCSLNILRALFKSDVDETEVLEMEGEAFLELGNMVLNSVIGTLANQLPFAVDISLPAFSKGIVDELSWPSSQEREQDNEDICMLMNVELGLLRLNAKGNLVIFLTADSSKFLLMSINDLLSVG